MSDRDMRTHEDDARIWQGLRTHLDDLGGLAPAPRIAELIDRERRSGRRNVGAIVGLPVALGVIALVGVLLLAPRSPNVGPVASPSLPSDPLTGVQVTCDAAPSGVQTSPGLTCGQAINAVLNVVPTDHISSILFGFSGQCPPDARCAAPPPSRAAAPVRAFVLVQWSDGKPDMIVSVTLDPSGDLVIGTPERLGGLPAVPVDTSLQAVSLSNPPSGAEEALNLCVRPENLDQVIGMAQLPANDVRRFMLTNGREPELQSDTLVWAMQLKGFFPSRVSGARIDPLCVVVDTVPPATPATIPYTYAPYGSIGGFFSPPAGFVGPEAALPSLAP